MGLVDDDGNVDHYGGSLRVMDADGNLLADRIDPTTYTDYLGEAVEPWTYLKSTYWKALGYPDGVYRVGPLARVIVADQMGTPRADAELAEFRRRLGRVPSSSFNYHYARLIDALHAAERIEELLRGPDILLPRVRSFAGMMLSYRLTTSSRLRPTTGSTRSTGNSEPGWSAWRSFSSMIARSPRTSCRRRLPACINDGTGLTHPSRTSVHRSTTGAETTTDGCVCVVVTQRSLTVSNRPSETT